MNNSRNSWLTLVKKLGGEERARQYMRDLQAKRDPKKLRAHLRTVGFKKGEERTKEAGRKGGQARAENTSETTGAQES